MKRSKRSREQMRDKFDLHEIPAFEKKFRGYDADAVDDYLNALVDAYTAMYAECEALRRAAQEHGLFREKVAHVLIEREIDAPKKPGEEAAYGPIAA